MTDALLDLMTVEQGEGCPAPIRRGKRVICEEWHDQMFLWAEVWVMELPLGFLLAKSQNAGFRLFRDPARAVRFSLLV